MHPLESMESLGWLGGDVWFAHGIHFNDEELKVLKQTNTGVCHCPISNIKLSSGIARIPEMLDMRIRVGLGVDGSASNHGSNLLEEIRVAYLLHRLNSSRKAPRGYDILKMATVNGAKVLERDDIVSLELGKCADLFMIDSTKLELVGTYKNPVDYTIVNGKIVVENVKIKNIDEKFIAYKANEEVKRCCCRINDPTLQQNFLINI